MPNYKAFIIGCGKIAGVYDDLGDKYIYSHAGAYSGHKKINMVGCYDSNAENLRKLSEKYNIDAYECSYIEALTDAKPDIVSICTPDNTHFGITKSILESNFIPKIIFLEKPVCDNKEQLEVLINTAENKDIKVVVNHSRRFDAQYQALKRKIQKSEFGNLIKVDAVYYSGWKHNGVHTVDTLNFLFDDELQVEQIINSYDSPYKNDPNLDFKCKFKKNKSLVYLTAMDEKHYQLFEFDFKFENARIRFEDFGNRLSYEKKIVNSMNEQVLIKSDLSLLDGLSLSPIQSAVKILVDNLDSGSSLNGYLLKDIATTMNTIWSGSEWAR